MLVSPVRLVDGSLYSLLYIVTKVTEEVYTSTVL